MHHKSAASMLLFKCVLGTIVCMPAYAGVLMHPVVVLLQPQGIGQMMLCAFCIVNFFVHFV